MDVCVRDFADARLSERISPFGSTLFGKLKLLQLNIKMAIKHDANTIRFTSTLFILSNGLFFPIELSNDIKFISF